MHLGKLEGICREVEQLQGQSLRRLKGLHVNIAVRVWREILDVWRAEVHGHGARHERDVELFRDIVCLDLLHLLQAGFYCCLLKQIVLLVESK